MKLRLISKLENANVLDSSNSYKVIMDIFGIQPTQSSVMPENDVTLVSQTSSSHLYDVIDLGSRWDGYISIAFFTYKGDFENMFETLLRIYACQPSFQNRIFFHVVFPLAHTISFSNLTLDPFRQSDCQIRKMTKQLQNYNLEGIDYPVNLLRNTARKYSKSKYNFVIDIDLMPSLNLREQFNNLVSRMKQSVNESVNFVVPSFESKDIENIPTNREQIIRQWSMDKIRPFSYEICWECQQLLDYKKWRFLPSSETLDVKYFVAWKLPWEPFYIGHKSVPLYDERFKQYGFNRISQVGF